MNHIPNASRINATSFACTARVYELIARLLLFAIAVSLMTAPMTQRIWTWDHFLHGGQDFESTALTILAILCLVLVLSHHGKQQVDLLFAARRLFSVICYSRALTRPMRSEAVSTFPSERLSSPVSGMYPLPLQI